MTSAPKKHLDIAFRGDSIVEKPDLSGTSAPARLLRSLLVHGELHWMEGFVLFERWRSKDEQGDYQSRFKVCATRASELLRACIGITDTKSATISSAEGVFRIRTVSKICSNVATAAEVLRQAEDWFCRDDQPAAWSLVADVFKAARDPTVIDPRVLLRAVQQATRPPPDDARFQELVETIENAVDGYSESLAEAITKVACLVATRRRGIARDTAVAYIERWCRELGAAGEFAKLLAGYPVETGRVTDRHMRQFVNEARRYRELHQELMNARNEAEKRIIEDEFVECRRALCQMEFVTKAAEITAKDFKDQPQLRIKEQDVTAALAGAVSDFILQHRVDIPESRFLFGRFKQYLYAYVRACRTARDLPRVFVVAGPDELVDATLSILAQVKDRAKVETAIRAILAQFPRRKTTKPDPGALAQAREFLAEEALQRLQERLHNEGPQAYVQLSLQQLDYSFSPPHGLAPRPTAWNELFRKQEMPCPVSPQQLIRAGGRHLISAMSGAGKTTFLRRLQMDTAQLADGWLPIFVPRRALRQADGASWSALKCELTRLLNKNAPHISWSDAVEAAERARLLLLFVDHVEDMDEHGPGCAELAAWLAAVPPNVALVVAARPTAADLLRERAGLQLVQLRPFDSSAVRAFFGAEYDGAVRASQGDQELLTTPLLAYLLRRLLRKKQGPATSSRWDLYSRVITDVLYEHASRGRGRRHQWIRDIETLLGVISYGAIALPEPHWVSMPYEVWHRLSAPVAIPIDALPTAGFADLVVRSSGSRRPSLIFAHRSFQEYYAACWVASHDDHLALVLRESWNPKWHGVLSFLAGKIGAPLIERMLSEEDPGDVADARLFLAATCAGEVPALGDLEQILIGPLVAASQVPLLQLEALRALAAMRTARSRALAWSTVIRTRELECDEFVTVHLCRDMCVVRPLFSRARVRWALHELDGNDPADALSVLAHWPWAVSDAVVHRAVEFLCHPETRVQAAAGRLLWSLGSGLPQRELSRIAELTAHPADFVRRLARGILAADDQTILAHLPCFVAALADPHLDPAVHAASVLSRVAARLDDEHVIAIKTATFGEGLANACYVARALWAVKDRLPENEFGQIVAVACAPRPSETPKPRCAGQDGGSFQCDVDEWSRVRAALAWLYGGGHRLTDAEANGILRCLDVEDIRSVAIETISTLGQRSARQAMVRLLDDFPRLATEDRIAIVESLQHLWRYIRGRHRDFLVRGCADSRLAGRLIPVMASIAGVLSARQLEMLVENLVAHHGYMEPIQLRNAAAWLAPYVCPNRLWEDARFEPKSACPFLVQLLLWLTDPSKMQVTSLSAIGELLHHPDAHVRCTAHLKLREIHAHGRLQPENWAAPCEIRGVPDTVSSIKSEPTRGEEPPCEYCAQLMRGGKPQD
jgi:hypothetical protein